MLEANHKCNPVEPIRQSSMLVRWNSGRASLVALHLRDRLSFVTRHASLAQWVISDAWIDIPSGRSSDTAALSHVHRTSCGPRTVCLIHLQA